MGGQRRLGLQSLQHQMMADAYFTMRQVTGPTCSWLVWKVRWHFVRWQFPSMTRCWPKPKRQRSHQDRHGALEAVERFCQSVVFFWLCECTESCCAIASSVVLGGATFESFLAVCNCP